MHLKSLSAVFRVPHLAAATAINRDYESFVRLHFLVSALKSGLLQAMVTPISADGLATRLGVQRTGLLSSLLDLGVTLGELSVKDGRYSLKGRRSRAMTSADFDPMVALTREVVDCHASAYQELSDRLRGAPLGDYLEEAGPLIARSSRVFEPFLRGFVTSVVKTGRPMRMLEIGCGSGVYLRHAAAANPLLSGAAIDLQPAVVEQAAANLKAWGIDRRFQVMVADIRYPPPDLVGPFDIITFYNNVYYFQDEERLPLFRNLRSRLAAKGFLALATTVKGRSVMSDNIDLFLRSTAWCAPLPKADKLMSQLIDAGFGHVSKERLMPTEPFYGFVASGVPTSSR